MKEGEARMAQLDWAGPYDYRTFFGALDNHLKWWTVKKAVPGADQKPIVASSELKIIPLIQFCQNTKGMPATGEVEGDRRLGRLDRHRRDPRPDPRHVRRRSRRRTRR